MKCVVPSCNRDATDLILEPLCPRCAKSVYAQLKEMIRDAGGSTRVNAGMKSRALKGRNDEPGIVYFVRFGDLMKIGFTTDMGQRMKFLKPDRIVATFPGTRMDERAAHMHFGKYWDRGELFDCTDDEAIAYAESMSGESEAAS